MDMVESILAADIGSLWTKAILLDRVAGDFRFVARGQAITTTTDGEGVMAGLRVALQQIEGTTGRRLLTGEGLLTPEDEQGHGVDAFVAVTSAAEPLALVVAGLIREMSASVALRVARTIYCDVRAILSTDGGLADGHPRRWSGLGPGGLDGVIAGLPALAPEAIFIAGGTDGGSVAPLADLAQAILDAHVRPPRELTVIFAGNAAARQAITGLVAGQVDLRVVENVTPTLDRENLIPAAQELEALYRQRNMSQLPGYRSLAMWSMTSVLPSAPALGLVLRFLARQYSWRVLGVDVGGSNTILDLADGDTWQQTVQTGLGIGDGCEAILKIAGVSGVTRWLPFDIGDDEVRAYVAKRQASPWTIPATAQETWLDQALAREALRSLGGLPWRADLIVAGGGTLAHARSPGQTVLALLDGREPVGISQLAVDNALMLPSLGAVAGLQPQAAGEVAINDALSRLGTAICPSGRGIEGRPALRATVRYADGKRFQVETPFGVLERIAVEPGQKVHLELKPAGQLDLGVGPGQGVTVDVEAEGLGILIDCRGRPLCLPTDPGARLARVQEWAKSVGAWE